MDEQVSKYLRVKKSPFFNGDERFYFVPKMRSPASPSPGMI